MDPISTLKELFISFPGIGKRQAERFVYFLLRQNKKFTEKFIESIIDLKKTAKSCSQCQRFFIQDASKDKECSTCKDVTRDKNLILVVAHDADLYNIDQSGNYKGFYFVLGGTIPILDKEPKKKIRIELLKKRIQSHNPNEVILALSTNPEGENTRDYITKELKTLQKENKFTISTLGRGLSTGAELEYSDPDTIKSALANRSS